MDKGVRMELSEEEAIERLKERVKLDRKIRDNKAESDYEQFCENECQAIETILNLADKQRKEIEEKNCLIDVLQHRIEELLNVLDNEKKINYIKPIDIKPQKYISEDTIKEKIELYNIELEHIKNGEEFENEKPMYYWGKVALEDLLEEN